MNKGQVGGNVLFPCFIAISDTHVAGVDVLVVNQLSWIWISLDCVY